MTSDEMNMEPGPGPTIEPDAKCPHCDGDIYLNMKAVAPESAKLSFRITMEEGHRQKLGSLAGIMSSLEKLLVVQGKELGVKTFVFLLDIRMDPTTIEFDLMLANTPAVAK